MPPVGLAEAACIGLIFFPNCMLPLLGAEPPAAADEFTGTDMAWKVAWGAGSFVAAFVSLLLVLLPLVGWMPSKRLVCRPWIGPVRLAEAAGIMDAAAD